MFPAPGTNTATCQVPTLIEASPVHADEEQWVAGAVEQNIRHAIHLFREEGVSAAADWASSGGRAFAVLGARLAFLNPNHRFWKDPYRVAAEARAKGWLSTGDPSGVIYHETAHAYDLFHYRQLLRRDPSNCREWLDKADRAIAIRVSGYAATNSIEFVAEAYSAIRCGLELDPEVLRLYRKETGRNP